MEKRQVKVLTNKGEYFPTNREGINNEPNFVYGIFHEWEQYQDGDYSAKKAIVEFENGSVKRCDIDEIIFTNKPAGSNMFEEGLEK